MTDRTNRSSPDGWTVLARLAAQREAIEDALKPLEQCDCGCPREITARLRLARA